MAFTTLVVRASCSTASTPGPTAERVTTLHQPLAVGAVALSLALQVAVVHVPWLGAAFGTVPLSFTDWLICSALASCVLWADGLRKLLARHRRAPERA